MLRKTLLGAGLAAGLYVAWIPFHVSNVCWRRDFNTWNMLTRYDNRELDLFLNYLQTSEWQESHPYRTYFGWKGWIEQKTIDKAPISTRKMGEWLDSFSNETQQRLTLMNKARGLPEWTDQETMEWLSKTE